MTTFRSFNQDDEIARRLEAMQKAGASPAQLAKARNEMLAKSRPRPPSPAKGAA